MRGFCDWQAVFASVSLPQGSGPGRRKQPVDGVCLLAHDARDSCIKRLMLDVPRAMHEVGLCPCVLLQPVWGAQLGRFRCWEALQRCRVKAGSSGLARHA